MNIGVLITIPKNEHVLQVQQALLFKLSQQKNTNVTVFADSFFCAPTTFPVMPVGNLNSFSGDLICFNAKDARKVYDLKRNINIKYICSIDVTNIEQTFGLDDIEYFAASENDAFRAQSLTGQSTIPKIEEWIK
tara:strand:- start:114 stop:515 length:402 start_codon:yes stop_codon:yes gene_type:complete